jgi:L-rhamnose isomerase
MDFTKRLVLFEEFKSLPWSAVWDYYCMTQDVPVQSRFTLFRCPVGL